MGRAGPARETRATGAAQSPTNLTGGRGVDLTDAVFSYKLSAVTAVNNGHTVQVDIADGGSMGLDGKTYTLKAKAFGAIFAGGNARPVQDLGSRALLTDSVSG